MKVQKGWKNYYTKKDIKQEFQYNNAGNIHKRGFHYGSNTIYTGHE